LVLRLVDTAGTEDSSRQTSLPNGGVVVVGDADTRRGIKSASSDLRRTILLVG
jgi:hypothetical protein